MTLPKTMSDSLVKKLNNACIAFQGSCDLKCDKIGWCDACWIAVGGEARKSSSSVGRAPAIQGVDSSSLS